MIDQGLPPPTFQRPAGPLPLLVAIMAAIAVAHRRPTSQGVEHLGCRRRTRCHLTGPVTAARLGSGHARRRSLAGSVALCVVAMSFNVTIALSVSPTIVIVAIVTVGLFAPRFVSAGVRLIGIRCGGSGPAGSSPPRTPGPLHAGWPRPSRPSCCWSVFAGMTVFQQTTLAQEADRRSDARHVADIVIAAGAGGLTAGSVDVLAFPTSIVSAVGLLPTDVYAGGNLDIYAAQAVTPGRLDEVLNLGVTAGALTGLSTGEVAISGTAAKAMSLNYGDVATLRLGDGSPLRATVAAVYDRGLGFADVLITWTMRPTMSLIRW